MLISIDDWKDLFSTEAIQYSLSFDRGVIGVNDWWRSPRCDPPDVSIIVRFFNGNHSWLERAIQSALDQEASGTSVEVIVVDDGSSRPMNVDNRPLSDGRIGILRHSFNRGAAAAKNSGIRKSRGKYVRILDHDDELLPGALSKQIAYLNSNSASVCLGISESFEEGVAVSRLQNHWDGNPETIVDAVCNHSHMLVDGPATLWRKDRLRFEVPESFRSMEDLVWLRENLLACDPKEVVYLSDPVFRYRRRSPTSIYHGFSFDSSIYRERIVEAERTSGLSYLRDFLPSLRKIRRPIRLAYLLRVLTTGGAEWQVAQYAARLDPRYFEIRVFLFEHGTTAKSLQPWFVERGIDLRLNPRANGERPGEWLEAEFQQWEPDIVQNLWKVLAPALVTRGTWKKFTYITSPRDPEKTPPEVLEQMDRIVSVSSLISDLGLGPDIQSKVISIRNAVDVLPFQQCGDLRQRARAVLGLSEEERVILWSGRLWDECKRPDILRYLIDSVSSLEPGVTFLVNGYFRPDSGVELMKAWTDTAGRKRVVWVNDAQPWHAPILAACSDIFLCTSDVEGLSLSTLEAMAAALPVVTTDVGGQREAVIDGSSGFVVPAGAKDEILARLLELLRMSQAQRKQMGELGRNLCIAQFSLEENIRRHIVEYIRAVEDEVA